MAEVRTDPSQLTGPEKAALLLLALGEHAAPLWNELDDEDIKDVSFAMSNLGPVAASTVEKLIGEFIEKLAGGGGLVGSYEATQRLLASFLPEDKVEALMEEIRGPAGRTMWDKLGNVNEQVLASYLKNEYPQTVAVVLSKIRPDHAARVLSSMPDEFALECMSRMLRMEPVQREILDKIELTLRTEFMSNLVRTNKRDSHEMMADIFNSFDRATEARFFAALETRQPESAERIRALMFVFEDLKKMDSAGVQVLLRAIDTAQLAMALKGASDELRKLFFDNMSERAARILREDMNALGPVRLKDVDASQSQMLQKAKELAQAGEIVLVGDRAEDELIY